MHVGRHGVVGRPVAVGRTVLLKYNEPMSPRTFLLRNEYTQITSITGDNLISNFFFPVSIHSVYGYNEVNYVLRSLKDLQKGERAKNNAIISRRAKCRCGAGFQPFNRLVCRLSGMCVASHPNWLCVQTCVNGIDVLRMLEWLTMKIGDLQRPNEVTMNFNLKMNVSHFRRSAAFSPEHPTIDAKLNLNDPMFATCST